MYTFIHVARQTDHFFNRPMATQFTFDDGAVGIWIVFRPNDIGLVGNEFEWASGRVFMATRNRAVTATMSPNPRKRSLSFNSFRREVPKRCLFVWANQPQRRQNALVEGLVDAHETRSGK